MPKPSREPSLLKDVGALAGMYTNVLRLMEKRATGHSLIVRYEPPEVVAEPPKTEVPAAEVRRERVPSAR